MLGLITISTILLLIIIQTSADCPAPCKCNWILDSLEVDCSGQGLTEYPTFDEHSIEQLDLSNNKFTQFPSHLSILDSLMHLDMSGNQLTGLDEEALIGFRSLRTLNLANNSFTKWKSLNPSKVFTYAIRLHTLSLAGNAIQSFTDVDETFLLVSSSLTRLDVSYCKLAKPAGEFVLSGMPNLERLVLRGNVLQSLVAFPQSNLKALDLSECGLTRLGASFMTNLDNLEELNLSNNPGLVYGSKLEETLESDRLTSLDLSVCNMDTLEIEGFPNLVKLNFRGNMIRTIDNLVFQDNPDIEILDLSGNSIRSVHPAAFPHLTKLRELDLSFNSIGQIDPNLFKYNSALTAVNLSHNFISKLAKVISDSLRKFDVSWNIISGVEHDALGGFKMIRELDMSNNYISVLPGNLKSETLQKWDLSMCRLSAISNNTFKGVPELSSLKLSGNRFTNSFLPEFFESNHFLENIWLGDNPWICDCGSDDFKEFYTFLTERPSKIKDKPQLRCASPAHFYGKMWDSACLPVWHPPANQKSSPSQVLAFITFAVLVMMVCVIVAGCVKKCIRERNSQRNEREYFRNSQELRDVQRANQRMLENEAQLNAPDPRESNPPCYEDALLMPKLERSFKSMDELSSRRNRKKIVRSKTEVEMGEVVEDDSEDIVIDSHRYRSVDMLSNRCKERTAFIGTFRRTGVIQAHNSGSRIFSAEESRFPPAHIKAQNLQSAEQIGNFQSYENSPYTKRKQKHLDLEANFKRASVRDSIEFLTDSECQSVRNSPFARRRPKGSTNSILSVHSERGKALLPPVEDHYKRSEDSNSNRSCSSDFDMMNARDVDIESLPDSDSPARSLRSEVVVVHSPNRSSNI